MSEEKPTTLASARKRRGVVRASLTRMEDRVARWEEKEELTHSENLAAQRLLDKVNVLDQEFKGYHYAVVDFVEEESVLEHEQAIFDEHEDRVIDLIDRLQHLLEQSEMKSRSEQEQPLEPVVDASLPLRKRMNRLERRLRAVQDAVRPLEPGPDLDFYLVQQLEEQVVNLRQELEDVGRGLVMMERDDEGLGELEATLDKALFNVALQLKRLIGGRAAITSKSNPISGVKLPKIEVPTFDGSILNWGIFWDQFRVAVHDKPQLADPDKLAYLRHAVKDGTARHVIEGLSHSANNYKEAIECLQNRYDRPRLIYREHVRAILDATTLKEGNGRELRRLHDTVSQHLRALKAMKLEPSGPFVTAILELKLDQGTMFQWQSHSQDQKDVPHYQALLNFLDLRAQASETAPLKTERLYRDNPVVKRPLQQKPSYPVEVQDICVACKTGKHPLYTCMRFRALPHPQMMGIVKDHNICMNCLKPGHFLKQCPSQQRCRKCQKPHHTWLHIDADAKPQQPKAAISHASQTGSSSHQVLLMTCQVQVVNQRGYITRARALLDSASSMSFITERLAQHLRLPRTRQAISISGIGGHTQPASRGVVQFNVVHLSGKGTPVPVEAVVLPKVTTNLPVLSIPFSRHWKHLTNLRLADPEFGTSGPVDLLLGADVFVHVMRHGRRHGPSGTPSAFQTTFGWVLAGTVRSKCSSPSMTCCVTTTTNDDLLRRFWEVENVDPQQKALTVEERIVMDHFRANYSRDDTGRFVVSLPRKPNVIPLGESRSLAVKRFLSVERSLKMNGRVKEFHDAVQEYVDMNHAEPVPTSVSIKPEEEIYYMPMHVVVKSSSTTMKLRIVFDASAKSTSGTSLNHHLLVGPTVH